MKNFDRVVKMKTFYQGAERRSVPRDENDELNTYIREISSYPQLSPNRKKNYAKELKTATLEAKQELIRANLKLVVTIARKTIHIIRFTFC